MAIQNGSKRITKIYHGNSLVYQDMTGKWQTIALSSDVGGEKAEYSIIEDTLCFKPQIIDPFKFINNYEQVPSKTLCVFNNLKIASVREDTIGIANTTGGAWEVYPKLTDDNTIILATRKDSATLDTHFRINIGGIAVTIKK